MKKLGAFHKCYTYVSVKSLYAFYTFLVWVCPFLNNTQSRYHIQNLNLNHNILALFSLKWRKNLIWEYNLLLKCNLNCFSAYLYAAKKCQRKINIIIIHSIFLYLVTNPLCISTLLWNLGHALWTEQLKM